MCDIGRMTWLMVAMRGSKTTGPKVLRGNNRATRRWFGQGEISTTHLASQFQMEASLGLEDVGDLHLCYGLSPDFKVMWNGACHFLILKKITSETSKTWKRKKVSRVMCSPLNLAPYRRATAASGNDALSLIQIGCVKWGSCQLAGT